ncbi:maleylpyruvate isomerase N-terminal domain-containing protein [Ornithinimicrobium pratense]|uniref:Maleylpyruvate isomerase family mycothiol-dependent enzyme n=1 Tax=Ornithinimicrobium pratense TaxID=2593973 RepID=A0A5J6V7U7_9MICO|nr:maleylpyruvate isomerase N-terminal domain-containing protein [Ornithinimicrobium pratense]QFG69211.1 maleylpyruvate isomerase family mycothiol-dependent enzyme [Ornithinimicrobium pratense]
MEHRTVEEHVTGLRTAVDAFARFAARSGVDAVVPTCPTWTVRKLLAHQGMVHRWARANLLGQDCHPPSWNAEGQQAADPVAWLLEGADAVIGTLREVPDDVRADVFLKDAPAPRVFWARRQCHETTIHAVDALAASLGRLPTPQDADFIDPQVALDGVDEMLTGFVTRGRSRFQGAGPLCFGVRPAAGDRAWAVEVQADGAVVTTRLEGEGGEIGPGTAPDSPVAADPDSETVTIRGSAPALYLALWNRTSPDAVDDPVGILDRVWRQRARVRWS